MGKPYTKQFKQQAMNLVTEQGYEPTRAARELGRPLSTLLLWLRKAGWQYACALYRELLSEHGIECSMSRPGNCYDNACAESFFGTLKTELVHRTNYHTREEARTSIFQWIECWYNRRRRHSSLDYLSPEAFEAQIN